MPSLKTLRNRIASVKATQKITKAMQMVAAAKLRRAQAAAEAARPYAQRMERVLGNLASGIVGADDTPALLRGTGSEQRHLFVVCTGDRGLAGAFNSSIARLARERASALIAEGKDVRFLCVGRKGGDLLRRQFGNRVIDIIEMRSVRQIGFTHAEGIARRVLDMFAAGEFDVATLFFAQFRSVVSQIPTATRLIPAEIPQATAPAAGTGAASAIYEYEPEESAILEDLLPRKMGVQIFRALLENQASFYGAQMSAMDNATRNAGEMIRKLTLNYNRTRQAMITKELIEIISGAEAV